MSLRIGDAIGNTINLNNNKNISDLIIFKNKNPSDSLYNNITINFDDNYISGIINNKYEIRKFDDSNGDLYPGLFDEIDYYLSIDNENLNLKNTNIKLYFDDNLYINDNLLNIIHIDKSEQSIKFDNYTINISLNNNELNILDNISGNNLVNFKKTGTKFNCDLKVDNLLVDNIRPLNTTGVTITDFSIEKKKFDDVIIGNINSIENKKTPLIINKNIFNNNETNNSIEINRYDNEVDNIEDVEATKIFSINNKGYINLGNCYEINNKSFINIDNYNEDYVLNNNYNLVDNNLELILNYKGDYIGDTLTINKYGNISLGNENRSDSLLSINRNDDRQNLDINNSNNINIDNPLLKFNINYDHENNYRWFTEDRFDLYFENIFTSTYFQNIESIADTNPYLISYRNNYSSNFANLDSGLGENFPKFYYTHQQNKYFFLNAYQINSILEFDYTKLNIEEINNKTPFVDNVYDSTKTYNILYNRLNLKTNDNQITYDFKTISWQAAIGSGSYVRSHIIYPDKISLNDELGNILKEYNLEIVNIRNDITQAQRLIIDKEVTSYNYENFYLYPIGLGEFIDTTDQNNPGITDGDILSDKINLIDYLADRNIFKNTITGSQIKSEVIDTTTESYFKDFTCIRHVEEINGVQVPLFAIHISKKVYDNFNNYRQKFKNYHSNIIPKSNFIELTSNNKYIAHLTSDGTLSFNNILPITSNELHGSSKDYSIYSKDKRCLFEKIETNSITTIDNIDALNFNNKNFENIGLINFNDNQIFNISNLILYDVGNNNNQININNSKINIDTSIIGLKWKLSQIKPDDSYTNINSVNLKNIFENQIKNVNKNSKIYFIDFDELPYNGVILNNIYLNNNIELKKIYTSKELNENNIDILNHNNYIFSSDKYYIPFINNINFTKNEIHNILDFSLFENNKYIYQTINIYNKELYLIHDSDNNYVNENFYPNIFTTIDKLYTNKFIDIDSHNNVDIHPSISIYGSNASYILKSYNNPNISYMSSLKYNGFKNLDNEIGGDDDKKNIFEISYIKQSTGTFDDTFYDFNTNHILQHIGDDYDMITLGENYNICIDNKGPEIIDINSANFGQNWMEILSPSGGSIELIDTIAQNILKERKTLTFPEFFELKTRLNITKFLQNDYFKVNIDGQTKYFVPTSNTHTELLENNTSNSSYKISLGVPFKNEKINNLDNGYMYNFPRYFKEVIKDTSDYMLNIYGNTKIYGIDGDTNALSVKINETKGLDDEYKINASIGTDLILDENNTTFNIGGYTYSDKIFYKKIEDSTYINVSNIHNNVINDIKENIFPEELKNSIIHTSNINNNTDNGIFNIELIPNIPVNNLALPDPPDRQVRIKDYIHPVLDGFSINTNQNYKNKFPSDNDHEYYNDDLGNYNSEIINSQYNGYHYFNFDTQNLHSQQNNIYNLSIKDSIICDVIIVGGGGGGGNLTPGLKWKNVGNILPPNSIELTTGNIQSLLEKFSSLNIGDIIDLTIQDLTTYALVDNVIYNNYLYDVSRNNYFITTSGGGGEGGQDRKITNVIIPKNTDIEIIIGHGGIGDGISGENISENGNFSKFNNDISQGGSSKFNFFGEGVSGNFTIADTAYKFFHEQYPNQGQLVNSIYKYFAGDGGTQGYIGGSGGGGGVVSGNSFGDATIRGGGGGYSSAGGWGKGADGIVLLRYRFKEKFEYFTESTPIDNLTNTYLEFNWQENKWVLNQYIADTSNIVTNKLLLTSNNLINNIDNTSNYSLILNTETSNNLIENIRDTSNYTEDISSNILYLSNDTSNYFNDVKFNIKNLNSENITEGIFDIDRLPLIPFSKFSNLDLNTIYSPKINHLIAEDTNLYYINKDYELSTEDNHINGKYLILTYDENDQYSTNQTEYFVEFLSDCKIDILMVGGGGGGGGTESINSGGGGGGGFIHARDINITRGNQFTMKVGNGGASKTNGYNTEAFGAIAFGGNHGNSDTPPELGQSGVGGTTSISNSIDIFKNKVVAMYDGGSGGTSSRAVDFDNNLVSGQSGNRTNFYYDKTDGVNEYYWGGGGGATRWNNNGNTSITPTEGLKYGYLPEGGLGGGGAGAFKFNDSLEINNEIADGGVGLNDGDTIIINRSDNIMFKSGGNGGKSTGGGGGGGFDINSDGIINGPGGHGGSGIIIIKYYNINIPSEGNRLKGYLGYNYNSSRWEMNSLDLLNLDINLEEVYHEINTKDTNVRQYIDSKFSLDLNPQTAVVVPLSWITNGAIIDHAITSANIFGYAGKGRPLNGETPDGDGLINLPSAAYTDQTNIYYPHLIKNEKFALSSLTNDNIADGTITFDKFYGKLDGSKISNGIINYSDIDGTITSSIRIFTDDPTQKISAGNITSVIMDLDIIDFSTSKIDGVTTIISEIDTFLKLPINKLNNILIDIINIDTSSEIIGTSTIVSSTNSIPISILKDIKVDIDNILNSGNSDFLLPTITLLGDIPKNYLTNVNVPITNVSDTSLVNTSVQLIYSGPTGLKWTYYSQSISNPILINNDDFKNYIKSFYLPNISTLNISQQQYDLTSISTLTINHYININNNIYFPQDISPTSPSGLVWIHSGYEIPTDITKIAIINTELFNILNNIIKGIYIDNELILTQTQKDSFLFPNLTHNHFIFINNEYFSPKDESKISPNLIQNLYLSANQIDTTIVDAFLNNVILNFDQSKLDPSVLAEISVTPNDIDFTPGSLNAIIDTSHIPSGLKWKFIGSSLNIPDIVNYGRELIQGTVDGDIVGIKNAMLPPEFKTIFTESEWLSFGIELKHNDYLIIGNNYFAPVSSLINPSFINPITILPTDLDNFNGNYTNKLQDVTIDTDTIKINPYFIDSISLTPNQIDETLDLSKNIYWLDTGLNTIPSINQATLLVNTYLSTTLNTKISSFVLLQSEWNSVAFDGLTTDHYINIKNNFYFPQSTNGLIWNNNGTTSPSGKIEIHNTILYDLLTLKIENIFITTSEIQQSSITSLFPYNYILVDNGHYFIPNNIHYSLLNKLHDVTIETTESNKINPSIVAEITLTADQFNESGKFGSVILSDLSTQSIDPSLISSIVQIDSIHLKTGFIDILNESLGKHRLPSDINYNFTSESIDPTLIPSSVSIDGTMLITSDPSKKLENVTIINNVDTSVISDGGGIGLGPRIEGTLTSTSGTKINNVVITSSFDVSFINNATITDTAILTTDLASTISGRAFIFGDIPVNVINEAIININNTTTLFTTSEGNDPHFSGVTIIDGEIDASFVNNANITLGIFNGFETKFKTGTTFTGDVTITGIVDASHISEPVTLNIQGGNFDGNDIADNTINSDKLTNNLTIDVNTINFVDGTSMNSAVSSDILTGTQISNLYISKIDFNTIFTKPSINSLFQFEFFNDQIGEFDTTNSSLYLYDTTNLSISTNLPFNSLIDDNSQLIINSKNSTSYFHIKSYHTSDYGANSIGIKNSFSNDTIGGSIINFKNSRFCVTLNPLGITSQEINVFEFSSDSNFSHNELHIPKLVFSDGTEMTTAAISLLDENNQLIMNNSISGFNYNDTDVSGDGFIHCNGIHAQFDITAFSSTTQSDCRLKKDIKNIEYNNELLKLNPVSFKWIDPNKSNSSNVGFIAQDIEEIFPELVKNGVDNYKSVNYTGLIPYLVKHIQHLEERIEMLENK